MIQRYTPLKRTPIRKRRNKPRPGRIEGEELQAQRWRIFQRDKGICVKCGRKVIFNAPDEWPNSFHRAHRRNKRMWGDDDSNVESNCGDCHREHHTGGKVVPPKAT
jgi:hypothetical protein